MLVRYFMTREVLTLEPETSCAEAWQFFQENGLRRAPVVDAHGKVLGVVTDRDLIRLLPRTIGDLDRLTAEGLENALVSDCLGPVVLAVEPNDHLETAAQLMLRNKIGGLPVMQGDQLLGIITESDLFRVFVQMKHDARAVRLTLHAPAGMELPDPGRLALATGVQVYEHFTHPSPSGGDLVALRVSPGHVDPFVQRLRDAGFLLIDRKDPEAGA